MCWTPASWRFAEGIQPPKHKLPAGMELNTRDVLIRLIILITRTMRWSIAVRVTYPQKVVSHKKMSKWPWRPWLMVGGCDLSPIEPIFLSGYQVARTPLKVRLLMHYRMNLRKTYGGSGISPKARSRKSQQPRHLFRNDIRWRKCPLANPDSFLEGDSDIWQKQVAFEQSPNYPVINSHWDPHYETLWTVSKLSWQTNQIKWVILTEQFQS